MNWSFIIESYGPIMIDLNGIYFTKNPNALRNLFDA